MLLPHLCQGLFLWYFLTKIFCLWLKSATHSQMRQAPLPCLAHTATQYIIFTWTYNNPPSKSSTFRKMPKYHFSEDKLENNSCHILAQIYYVWEIYIGWKRMRLTFSQWLVLWDCSSGMWYHEVWETILMFWENLLPTENCVCKCYTQEIHSRNQFAITHQYTSWELDQAFL
jgi:hypothetical protein